MNAPVVEVHAPAQPPYVPPAHTDRSGREHIVKEPNWILFIRIAQVVVALLILALAAASENSLRAWTSVTGSFSFMIFLVWSLGFILFVGVATLLGLVYLILTPIFLPFLYNYWAALALEVLGVFAWLFVFAIMTAWASANTAAKMYNSANRLESVLYAGLGKDDYYSSAFSRYGWKTTAAASGIGLLELLLFLATLTTFISSLRRHRRSGGPAIGAKTNGHPDPETEVGGPEPIQMGPVRAESPAYGMNVGE
ncbi:MAG: hypothetical protein M1839_002180 [Geoglossum umbratile]|nr:MAG: hypothetical protein M1839_002180 [Geoglossum umbratile]